MTYLPASAELEQLFVQKYGHSDRVGWAPGRRRRFGYYLPSDVYEALVSKLVTPGCEWIDVGGGHDMFPENRALARSLAARCSLLVAVDPSENVHRNEFAHERLQCLIEYYRSERQFDQATMRMVVEHVERTRVEVAALHRLLRPCGKVVILTVNLRSPITVISRLTPFGLHHPIKRWVWGGNEEDTFPVKYL